MWVSEIGVRRGDLGGSGVWMCVWMKKGGGGGGGRGPGMEVTMSPDDSPDPPVWPAANHQSDFSRPFVVKAKSRLLQQCLFG